LRVTLSRLTPLLSSLGVPQAKFVRILLVYLVGKHFHQKLGENMIRRALALFASALAVAAGLVAVSTPAAAAASFTPTTGITPGTIINDVTITAAPGTFLCEDSGVETTTGTQVEYGLVFASSADTVFDFSDVFLGGVGADSTVSYTEGTTTSPAFDVEMPVLVAHDPANYILALGVCDSGPESQALHPSTVIGYSDVTMASSTVSQGGSATINLIDATTDGLSCDAGFNEGPYSLSFEIYSTFAAFYNGDDAVTVIPEGWDNDGPGFGSFTESQLPGGVSGSFTVPATLAEGSYVGAVYCINEFGFWGDSPPMGLIPFTVTAANLPATGVSAAQGVGIAALGSALIALGGIVWVLRRRNAKA
jgi:LPXTG-motif cell wall-anchored protein